jgi:hypothetical protein
MRKLFEDVEGSGFTFAQLVKLDEEAIPVFLLQHTLLICIIRL